MRSELNDAFDTILRMTPVAHSDMYGSDKYPDIHGTVYFYPFWDGTLVVVEAAGLPFTDRACTEGIFGFHIHEGDSCQGTPEEPFSETGNHYNPDNCEHPNHAGDFPPLFGNNGYALGMFYTNRFQPDEVVGRTVIIHDQPDDFHTQPSGDSGTKMACGEIVGDLV
ncbi:superoxide dismutase family protein [Qiania dongpingensis]|uniref:Superoxide dismutase family protein n=1 Tax=Qiania dongpingensis TaxID=2763669 RepID=A0A7G9G2R1_9FIRM|nr:superoxide dismutase family protein [Qiania dongpingensis]QNM05093.1 superoxide dismutase family protein [Qiania dongpingensis]